MSTKPQNLPFSLPAPLFRVPYTLRGSTALYLSRVLYKSTLFMQNKPNLPKAQMNVNTVITMNNEQITMNNANKNKPNQTQFKPNLLDTQMNVGSVKTKDYRKNDIFAVPENKANSNPKNTHFSQFFRVFLHFSLIHLAQGTQFNISTPIFDPKTNIP